MKTFLVWMEESKAVREITHQLLTNLGYSHDALEDENDIKFTQITKSKLQAAIDSLDVDEDGKEEAKNFLKTHPMEGLKSLIRSINPLSKLQQDKSYTQKATLPQGQQPAPHPQNPQQMPQQNPQQASTPQTFS